jgi:hypothetical protein
MKPHFRSLKHFIQTRRAFLSFKDGYFPNPETNDLSDIYNWSLHQNSFNQDTADVVVRQMGLLVHRRSTIEKQSASTVS